MCHCPSLKWLCNCNIFTLLFVEVSLKILLMGPRWFVNVLTSQWNIINAERALRDIIRSVGNARDRNQVGLLNKWINNDLWIYILIPSVRAPFRICISDISNRPSLRSFSPSSTSTLVYHLLFFWSTISRSKSLQYTAAISLDDGAVMAQNTQQYLFLFFARWYNKAVFWISVNRTTH
jgi:hypothetical protein